MKKQKSSFLVVSYTFPHFRMKRSRNNKETGSLIQLAYCTKVNHATRVTTLQLKQPICFYSVAMATLLQPLTDTPQQRTPMHDITLKVSTVIPFTLVLKQPLNHKHPATPYNGVFAVPIVREQYFTTLILIADTRRPFQQDCPPSLLYS